MSFPPAQEHVRARCSHPSGRFLPFAAADTQSSAVQRFERQVTLYPKRPAIRTEAGSLTYDELNRRANRLAHALLGLPGSTRQVGLLLEDGSAMIIAMLAVLKTGRLFVSLDPHYPAERLAYILGDSRVGCVISDRTLRGLAADLRPPGATLIILDELPDSTDDTNLGLYISPETQAYLIYTSGSTGKPKGVIHTHGSLLHNIRNYTNLVRIGCDDGLSALHSFAVSSAIVELFLALLNGASTHPWNFRARGFNGLADWLDAGGVTVVIWIPTPFRQFAAATPAGRQLSRIRLLMLGSEPVTTKDLAACRGLFGPNCVFMNRLGTTECGNYRAYFVADETLPASARIPAGFAIPGTESLLLNSDGAPLSEAGQVGQIAVATPSMSAGYWERPDLTHRAFVSDPRGGDRQFYLTGDLGRLDTDGCLEFLGRGDSQVKIRGFRVELSEIEMRLMEDPRLKDVIVTAVEDGKGTSRLVAYVVPLTNPAPSSTALRQSLAGKLPDHMVPWDYVFLDRMPTTPSGKTDRAALRAIPTASTRSAMPAEPAPRTSTETKVTDIWSHVLQSGAPGLDENFFEIGGDSLMAATVFVELESAFGRRLPLSALITAPTIRGLAQLLERDIPDGSWSPLVTIQSRGAKAPIFFVHAHQGNVIGYFQLARQLGDDQPFYAFQAQGLDGKSEAIGNFSEMAASYIRAMKSVQPRGPYHVGGFCFGGALAMEMARQLEDGGDEVALVVTIQGRSHSYPRMKPDVGPLQRWFLRAYRRIRTEAEAFRGQRRSLWIKHARGRIDRLSLITIAAMEAPLRRLLARFGLNLSVSASAQQIAFEKAHIRAFRSHHFQPVRSSVLVIRVEDQPLGIEPDPSLGWKNLVRGELRTVEIPGGQRGLFSDARVQRVAEAMLLAINRRSPIPDIKPFSRAPWDPPS